MCVCVHICEFMWVHVGVLACASVFELFVCQQATRHSIRPQSAIKDRDVEEEETRRKREGEEGVTSTGDCNKYVESNPLIRQQGVCGAIRFKWRDCNCNVRRASPGRALGKMSAALRALSNADTHRYGFNRPRKVSVNRKKNIARENIRHSPEKVNLSSIISFHLVLLA